MSSQKVKYKVPEFEDIVKSVFAQNKEIGANYVEGFERVFPVGWGKDAEGHHAYFHMAITDASMSPSADYDSYYLYRMSGGGEKFFMFQLLITGSHKYKYQGKDAYMRMQFVDQFGFLKVRGGRKFKADQIRYVIKSLDNRIDNLYLSKYDKLDMKKSKSPDDVCKEFMEDFKVEILYLMKKYEIKLGLGKVYKMPYVLNNRTMFYTEGRKYFMIENPQKGIFEAAFVAGDIFELVKEGEYLPTRVVDSYDIEVLGMIENDEPDHMKRQMVMFSRYTSEILWQNETPDRRHAIGEAGQKTERVTGRVFAGFYSRFYK